MSIRSVAVEVSGMEPMTAFYAEAFGVEFKEVVTRGRSAWFGSLGRVTLKFIQAEAEAPQVGRHTLGFGVPDVDYVLEVLVPHGGRLIGEPIRNGNLVYARIEDPDGNLLELYTD